jgi:molybdenum cofactor cytidylyltransferase
MIFGEFPVREAQGLILAHSLRLATATLKKGRVLSEADVKLLATSGINFVMAAKLEDGDLGEDEAAGLVADSLAGDNVHAGGAFTGRANLIATKRGLLVIDRARLDRLNLVDEAVTVATLPPYEVVAPRQMVATVKIIPFGVDNRVVDTCAALARTGGELISVRPFKPMKVALILSTLPGLKQTVLEATTAATRARVAALDGELTQVVTCPHDVGSIERALTKVVAAGAEMVLVSGASATVDRRDTVPAALIRAGGVIDHFGMPVDPGNLLLLGHMGPVWIVDLPGCARSPKVNGLDWVMRMLAAGLKVAPQDIMRMGPGGLLKDIPNRPSPREMLDAQGPRQPKVAGVVLAAGLSARMNGANKLLAEYRGEALVARAVKAATVAGLDPVVVVTGHDADRVEDVLPPCEVLVVRNPAPERGMASSLNAGLAALPGDVDAAMVLLGDMPGVEAGHLRLLIRAFDPDEGRAICVPVHDGRRGNPVLLARRFFDEVATIDGDRGARSVVAEHGELVCEVLMPDDAVLRDVDTPEDLS